MASLSAVTADRVRAAMYGRADRDLKVVRQALRVRGEDSDELALVCVRDRSWWLAYRHGSRLLVWAFSGDEEAELGFERQLREAGWREAAPRVPDPPAKMAC